jgi:hypothetical protein
MAKEHLNYDQHALTEGGVKAIKADNDTSNLLLHVVKHSPTPVIASGGGSKHIKLYFKGDGLVVMSSSSGGGRGPANAESQIRKSLASHGFEFPTMKQVAKQKKKQKDNPEEPPAE